MKEKKKIIRRLDKIGRIVIPKEIRKRFDTFKQFFIFYLY